MQVNTKTHIFEKSFNYGLIVHYDQDGHNFILTITFDSESYCLKF